MNECWSLLIGRSRTMGSGRELFGDSEYLLLDETKTLQRLPQLEPDSLPTDGSFWWLDIRNPGVRDLRLLQEHLRIHPLTAEDIQLGESREKCEAYEEYLFISLQLLDEDEFYGKLHAPAVLAEKNPSPRLLEDSSSCYILIFQNCLVTMHQKPLAFMGEVLSRRVPLASTMTSDWLAYILLDEIVDDLMRETGFLQAEVDAIEDLTLSLGHFDQSDMLRRIYTAHRRTTILSRLIQPKLDVIRTLSKRLPPTLPLPLLRPPALLYLRDVSDHLHTARQTLIACRDTLDRSHDNYLGQADIELARAGHRMNVTVGKMTAVTFLIGSGMAISSIMGMNVRVPFQEFGTQRPLEGLVPFVMLLTAMGTMVAIVFVYARAKQWV